MLEEKYINYLLEENELRQNYINEEIGDLNSMASDIGRSIFSGIGSGAMDSLSEFMIDSIFDAVGFKSETLLGKFFLEVLKEFIENVVIRNPGNISKYFSKEGCKYLSADLLVVVGESGSDILVATLLDQIKREGLIKNSEDGEASAIFNSISASITGALGDSLLIDALRKVIKEAFQNEILESLKPHLEKVVCEMDLSDEVGKYFGFGK